ncbi:class III extradiol ring-cleavage dioxygenase [Gilvimarinus sp. SDUM040013]|uniref:Class III extradiol ring-cleavage dioxygenase n=1 Tax=Gilvimarinus gilvus TaxID=3058038 RepID=A0ABU4S582_9GAMM|nr:class III extradiol ring-cleavage dioxygenase [Gilvimarinus sp. SDUM040013]MDO3387809.1 class III extradiol ring-cleavage dioxygenase [Gilvimarinus sp. SDUM040013]MDX6851048.1 class III extradiol ring-cleavage dioxygenase [Gilvimarinus sp. SDUM040013]
MMPSLFLSHGAPDRILSNHPARQFLKQLPAYLPQAPKAVVVVSAHWQSPRLAMTETGTHNIQYDFGGFTEAMYQLQYPAVQPAWLTDQLEQLLNAAGQEVQKSDRPLDHGAWTVLKNSFANADIPVAAVSLTLWRDMDAFINLGKTLAPLGEDNILLIGSGSASHNLSQLNRFNEQPPWVREFISWLQEKVEQRDIGSLTQMYQRAPHGPMAHPTAEHYLPLLVALGAASGDRVQRLHDSYELGTLNNSSWAFGG